MSDVYDDTRASIQVDDGALEMKDRIIRGMMCCLCCGLVLVVDM